MSEILFKIDPYAMIAQLLNVSSSPQSPCSSSPCKNEGTCVPSYKYGIFECLCKKGFVGEVCEKGETLLAIDQYSWNIAGSLILISVFLFAKDIG